MEPINDNEGELQRGGGRFARGINSYDIGTHPDKRLGNDLDKDKSAMKTGKKVVSASRKSSELYAHVSRHNYYIRGWQLDKFKEIYDRPPQSADDFVVIMNWGSMLLPPFPPSGNTDNKNNSSGPFVPPNNSTPGNTDQKINFGKSTKPLIVKLPVEKIRPEDKVRPDTDRPKPVTTREDLGTGEVVIVDVPVPGGLMESPSSSSNSKVCCFPSGG